MSFSIHKNDRAGSPVNEVMPASAGTYKIGMALAFTDGKLAVAAGTTEPTHIAAENKTVSEDGDLIYCHKIEPTVVYKTEMSVAGAKTPGSAYTLSADGTAITATAGGSATVVSADGDTVNDAVYVRFA